MRVTHSITIDAPPQICFDTARDIDLHLRTMTDTGERAIAGVTSGLIGEGEEVTWEARHFGVRHRMTVCIVAFEPPLMFRDRMIRGPFRRFDHRHQFDPTDRGTIMTDEIEFASPLGPIGWLFDRLILARHLRRLITGRSHAIRAQAENRRPPDRPG